MERILSNLKRNKGSHKFEIKKYFYLIWLFSWILLGWRNGKEALPLSLPLLLLLLLLLLLPLPLPPLSLILSPPPPLSQHLPRQVHGPLSLPLSPLTLSFSSTMCWALIVWRLFKSMWFLCWWPIEMSSRKRVQVKERERERVWEREREGIMERDECLLVFCAWYFLWNDFSKTCLKERERRKERERASFFSASPSQQNSRI